MYATDFVFCSPGDLLWQRQKAIPIFFRTNYSRSSTSSGMRMTIDSPSHCLLGNPVKSLAGQGMTLQEASEPCHGEKAAHFEAAWLVIPACTKRHLCYEILVLRANCTGDSSVANACCVVECFVSGFSHSPVFPYLGIS